MYFSGKTCGNLRACATCTQGDFISNSLGPLMIKERENILLSTVSRCGSCTAEYYPSFARSEREKEITHQESRRCTKTVIKYQGRRGKNKNKKNRQSLPFQESSWSLRLFLQLQHLNFSFSFAWTRLSSHFRATARLGHRQDNFGFIPARHQGVVAGFMGNKCNLKVRFSLPSAQPLNRPHKSGLFIARLQIFIHTWEI